MTESEERKPGTAAVVAPSDAPLVLRDSERLAALVEASTRMLAEATTHTERLMHRRNWRALLAAARELDLTGAMVEASVMVHTAERSIFRADEELPRAKGGRGIKADRDDIDPGLLREIRKAHRRADTRLFNELVKAARRDGEPLTRKAIRLAGLDARHGPVPDSKPKVAYYSGETGYITPRYILDAARRTMGGIDLDPASFAKANEFVEAERYFTERDDGLKQRWGGRVWLNPPYTRAILGAFVDRLIEHLDSRQVTQALLLVNNSTDADFFHRALNHAVAFCLLAGRVRFHLADGSPTRGSPIQGQVILYFSAEIDDALDRFTAEFSPYGHVCYPVWPDVA